MKVLVIGGGGREHAICWKISKSSKVSKIYCAPGNAGIAEVAECVNIKAMEFDKLAAFAKDNQIDLTVVGMDDPLVGGIVDVFEACIDQTLDQIDLEFEDNAAVCVVLASDGYPVHYEKGYPISGLETFKNRDGYYVFHAGTAKNSDGQIVTNGGRVLGVTAKGADLKQARANAYEATEWISFANKYMRHDIGKAIDEA